MRSSLENRNDLNDPFGGWYDNLKTDKVVLHYLVPNVLKLIWTGHTGANWQRPIIFIYFEANDFREWATNPLLVATYIDLKIVEMITRYLQLAHVAHK